MFFLYFLWRALAFRHWQLLRQFLPATSFRGHLVGAGRPASPPMKGRAFLTSKAYPGFEPNPNPGVGKEGHPTNQAVGRSFCVINLLTISE